MAEQWWKRRFLDDVGLGYLCILLDIYLFMYPIDVFSKQQSCST